MSYSKIILNSDIKLSWPYPRTEGEIVSDKNDVISENNAYTITLPPSNTVETGTSLLFNNIGFSDFTILYNNGEPVGTVMTPGEVREIYLTDNLTSKGVWQVIPFGGGTSGIITFSTETLNNSLNITNSTIIPPGGNIKFAISDSLNNLNNLTTQVQNGFLVVTGNTPLSYVSRKIGGGTNIDVQNGDGFTSDVIINLADDLVGLSNINVGNIFISVNTITTASGDQNINLVTMDTGIINLNGIQIDSSGNMTIPGITNIPGMLKASCKFSNTSGTIAILSLYNVSNVTYNNNNDQYTITFITPMSDTNYGVDVSCSNVNSTPPLQVRLGYDIIRTQNSVTIVLIDSAGEMLNDIPEGVFVKIF